MGRELSKREQVLLVFLLLILIGLGWYKLIYEPVNNQIANMKSKTDSDQTQIAINSPKVAKKKKMEAELVELRQKGDVVKIPSYDNEQALLSKLNAVLKDTQDYTLAYGGGEYVNDGIYFRTVSIDYTCETYEAARSIVDRLSEETYINQLTDVSYKTIANGTGSTGVSLSISFFEIGK